MALLTATAAGLLLSQAPPPAYTVSGSVVNAMSGEGIRRALVRLNGPGPQRNVFTDADGKFEIPNVAEGRYALTAQRPGFFDGALQQAAPTGNWVQVDANTSAVTIKLSPEALIEGRVTDESGKPLPNVMVQASEEQIVEGRKVVTQVNGSSTDEDGTYELTGLQPGRYWLRAGPGFENLATVRAQPRVYVPQYFPSGLDRQSAQPLDIAPGQTATADFQLTATPAFPVSGVAIPSTNTTSVQALTPDGEPTGLGGVSTGKPGQWRLLLPSGSWLVRATAWRPDGAQFIGEQTVRVVDGPLQNVQIATDVMPTVPVRVTGADGAALQMQLKLQSVTDNQQYFLIRDESGAAEFRAVMPGRYRLVALPWGGACIDSASAAGVDLTRDDYVVTAGGPPAPIDLTIGNDCGVLSIQSPMNQPQPGWLVVLSDSRLFQPQTAPVSGATFQMLAPGTYHVYQVPTLAGLEYANPEAMRSYRAQDIQIEAGEKKQITLEASAGGSE